jgi:hypothetical protein
MNVPFEDYCNKNMPMSSSQKPESHAQADPMNQLGAIQNIIMGPFMAEVNEKLRSIQEQLDRDRQYHEAERAALRQALTQELQQTVAQLSEQLRHQGEQTQARIETLSNEKTDRKELGQMLVDLGQSLLRNGV